MMTIFLDVVLDVAVLMCRCLEEVQPAVQLAVTEASVLRRMVGVGHGAKPREQLAYPLMLDHHHVHGVLHGSEERVTAARVPCDACSSCSTYGKST
jgi:hypothetical protein